MNVGTLFTGPLFRSLCVLLALVMASAPSASLIAQTNAAQQAVRQRVQGIGRPAEQQYERPSPRETREYEAPQGQPALGTDAIDTTYVSPDAIALVALRPVQIMTNPMAQMLPTEVVSAAGLKYLGFDPAEVSEAIAFVEPLNPAGPPEWGLVIKFNKPFRGSSINPQIRAHTQLAELAGRKYLQSTLPAPMYSLYGPDNQTLIVAPDVTLRRLVESAGVEQSGPIIDRVKTVPGGNDLYATVDIESLRPLIMMGLAQAQSNVPPDFQAFLEAPNLIKVAELTFNVSGHPVSLVVHANDESAAQQLESLISQAAGKYQEQMRAQFAEQAASGDPVEQALAQYMERVSGMWTEPFLPQRDGTALTFFQSDPADAGQQQMANVAIIGILVALLLPAIQAARQAAQRSQSMNNMKQINLAILNSESANRTYSAHASYSADGKPLLSWRVHILPYIEERGLYEQFKMDEPWDSEHNRALIALMPPVYANPNVALEPGKTNYLAVVGEQCIFNGTAEGTSIRDVTDGTSNTIMFVEAAPDQAVEWTKPDDWEFDPNNPKAGLGGIRPDGWIAAIADGSVRSIPDEIDPEQLKALFTRAGGEPVNAPF